MARSKMVDQPDFAILPGDLRRRGHGKARLVVFGGTKGKMRPPRGDRRESGAGFDEVSSCDHAQDKIRFLLFAPHLNLPEAESRGRGGLSFDPEDDGRALVLRGRYYG